MAAAGPGSPHKEGTLGHGKCFHSRDSPRQESLRPAQPWKGPQTLELNSPNFLGHLNIQEPLQVTVT